MKFNGLRKQVEMERSDLVCFLTYPAAKGEVSASMQNRALSALLLL
ncbi:hypothetical protein [Jeongeupia wiesaeckerbachi]